MILQQFQKEKGISYLTGVCEQVYFDKNKEPNCIDIKIDNPQDNYLSFEVRDDLFSCIVSIFSLHFSVEKVGRTGF